MKKVLILYASYGGGHLTAAKSIEECLNKNYPDIEVEVVDCIKYINKSLEKISTNAYKEMAKKMPQLWGFIYSESQRGVVRRFSSRSNKFMAIKLKNLVEEKNPDLIISTHPFSSQMIAYLKKKNKVNCELASVLTDFASHRQWLEDHNYSKSFFVANSTMKQELLDYGIEENKIHITGIPVSNRFSMPFEKNSIYDYFNLSSAKHTILFFGGGEFGLGRERTISIFESLIKKSGSAQIVAISGKNEKMKDSFEEVIEKYSVANRVRLLDFTDKVPELMHISDIVITKPGGLTTSESLISNLPIIIINPIPGQEEENAEFLEINNLGIWIKKSDNTDEIFENIFSDIDKLLNMKENTKLYAKPNATKHICDILIDKVTIVKNIEEKTTN